MTEAQTQYLQRERVFSPSENEWGGLQSVCVHSVRRSEALRGTFCYDGDYTRLEVSPALQKLFRWLDIGDHAFSWSFRGYRAWECENENCGVERVYLPMIKCGTKHPWTSFKHTSRCEARIIEQIEFLERNTPLDYISHLVLTAPGWVSEGLLYHDTLPRFRRAVHHFLRLLSRRLFRSHPHARLGAWFAVHPWSTRRPLQKHLHAHLLLPNISYNNKEHRFYRFRPYVDKKVIKECWRKALVRFGLWEPADPGPPDTSIQYYRLRLLPKDLFHTLAREAKTACGSEHDNPSLPDFKREMETLLRNVPRTARTELNPRVKHKIRYAYRFPLVDLNTYLTSNMLAGVDRLWARFLVDYTTRRLKAGFLVNLKRFGFICRKSPSTLCPLCGSELIRLGAIYSNLPDVPHLILNRKGEWERIPPPFTPLECQPCVREEDLIYVKKAGRRARVRKLAPPTPPRGRHPEADAYTFVGMGG